MDPEKLMYSREPRLPLFSFKNPCSRPSGMHAGGTTMNGCKIYTAEPLKYLGSPLNGLAPPAFLKIVCKGLLQFVQHNLGLLRLYRCLHGQQDVLLTVFLN